MPLAGLRGWVIDPRWLDVFSHLSSLLNQLHGTVMRIWVGHGPGARGGPKGPGH
jgi:hypothetical protein